MTEREPKRCAWDTSPLTLCVAAWRMFRSAPVALRLRQRGVTPALVFMLVGVVLIGHPSVVSGPVHRLSTLAGTTLPSLIRSRIVDIALLVYVSIAARWYARWATQVGHHQSPELRTIPTQAGPFVLQLLAPGIVWIAATFLVLFVISALRVANDLYDSWSGLRDSLGAGGFALLVFAAPLMVSLRFAVLAFVAIAICAAELARIARLLETAPVRLWRVLLQPELHLVAFVMLLLALFSVAATPFLDFVMRNKISIEGIAKILIGVFIGIALLCPIAVFLWMRHLWRRDFAYAGRVLVFERDF